MWKNMWENTVLICGNHGDDHSHMMELKNIDGTICYQCSCCNTGTTDGRCSNRLTVLELEKMLDKIDEKSGSIFSVTTLKGFRWKRGAHSFFVMDEAEGSFKIKVTKIR